MAKKSGIISMSSEDKKWRAESDLRILMEAEAINKDAERLKAARSLAKAKLLDLAGVAKEYEDES